MKMEQQQQAETTLVGKFYLFLRDRDARIIELFFLALNTYILALIILPPYTTTGMPLFWRALFQIAVTGFNLAALTQKVKRIRIVSAIANAAIMTLIAASLYRADDPNVGTYALLALLAAFVCWKINIRQ